MGVKTNDPPMKQVVCFALVKLCKQPVGGFESTRPPVSFSLPPLILPSIVPCIAPLAVPNCQEKARVAFAFICCPRDANCCQPAAVCSASHLISPSPLSTAPSLPPSVSGSPGKTADRCGGRSGRWPGRQGKTFFFSWRGN